MTIAWTSTFALALLLTVPTILGRLQSSPPHLLLRQGRWQTVFGIYENLAQYQPISTIGATTPRRLVYPYPSLYITSFFHSLGLFTPTSSFLNRFSASNRTKPLLHFPPLKKVATTLLIPLFLLLTILPQSQLRANPNRFGFISLACLPPLFLLSAKKSPIELVLKKSYVAVNFLHRWLGRAVVLMVLLHMYFWTIQYQATAQITLFLSGEKEVRGLTALGFLLLIAVSSLPLFRKWSYTIFFILHYVGIIGFLVFLNRHTIYARGWATWSIVGIYTVDIVGRVASMRLRWVEVQALEGGMTRVTMKGLHGGWGYV